MNVTNDLSMDPQQRPAHRPDTTHAVAMPIEDLQNQLPWRLQPGRHLSPPTTRELACHLTSQAPINGRI